MLVPAALALCSLTASPDEPHQLPAQPDRPVPTFNRDMAPILFAKCAPCHRPEGAGPFSLLRYADARKRAADIARVTASRYMPPWLPGPGEPPLQGERRLSDHELHLIQQWAELGTPEGEPQDLPPLPDFPSGWALGQPDIVIWMQEAYALAAEGADVIRNFVIPLTLGESRFIRAVELRPGNKRVVHHAVLKVDRTRVSRRLDVHDPQPGFGGMAMGYAAWPEGHAIVWAPGTMPHAGEPGIAWRLDPGTDLVLQLHMVPSGKPEQVRAEIGLHFARESPTRYPLGLLLRDEQIDIPAGQQDYIAEDSFMLPVPVSVLSLYPHAHYLGDEMQVWAMLPDGTRQSLLDIPRWDFNWQDLYRYSAPVALPGATTLHMRYVYDNSADNVRNPHQPPRRVVGGNQSADEMATLLVQVLPRDPAERAALEAAQFLEMLRDRPDDVTAHYNLGVLHAERGELAQAAEHYGHVVLLDPQDADAHFGLAAVYARQGSLERAAAHYLQVLALRPDFAEAHFLLGVVRERQGELQPAADHYGRAIGIDPAYARAHYRLGTVLARLGNLAAAKVHLRRALEIDPTLAAARARLDDLLQLRD